MSGIRRAFGGGVMASILVSMAVSVTHAATVTWKGGSGSWHVGSNWDTGAQPQQGDHAIVNDGAITYWGPTFGGMNATLINDSFVTINGGSVTYGNKFTLLIGNGGTGSGSAMTINGGSYVMAGASPEIRVGGDAGTEPGTLTIGPAGLFNGSNNGWLRLFATGTINTAGTVVNIGDFALLGGVFTITDGSFSTSRVFFESSGATGKKLNLSGGTFNVLGTVSSLELGYGDRYFNFTPDSTATLTFASLSPETLQTWVNSGYVRLDGVTDPSQFVVSAFGGSGSQVSLAAVPEPGTALLAGIGGLGLLARRRRHS